MSFNSVFPFFIASGILQTLLISFGTDISPTLTYSSGDPHVPTLIIAIGPFTQYLDSTTVKSVFAKPIKLVIIDTGLFLYIPVAIVNNLGD